MEEGNIFFEVAKPGKSYKIIEIKDFCNRNQLIEFGFIKGKELLVLKTAYKNSSFLVRLGTTMVGIDKQTAKNIIVKVETEK